MRTKKALKLTPVLAAQAEQMERDLNAIRRTLRRPLEAVIAKSRLTAPQLAVMRVVVRHEGISLKELSGEVNLAHSTVSGITDRLEKKGLIERRIDGADGRVNRAYPTAAVSEFVRGRLPALKRGPLEMALARTTAQEWTGIGDSLRRLRELLEETQALQ
jgi:DNA-binding MarR family transcriptional regulator